MMKEVTSKEFKEACSKAKGLFQFNSDFKEHKNYLGSSQGIDYFEKK